MAKHWQPVLKFLLFCCFLPYCALIAFLYFQQEKFIFQPERILPPPSETALAAMQVVRLKTADGLSLTSWYKKAQEGYPTIILFHGNGGNIAGREKARWFYEQGYGFLSVEYRGYGGNAGIPSEKGFYLDADAAYSFLKENDITSDNTIVWGESLGTAVATYYAAQHSAQKLILQSPFTTIPSVAAHHYWYVPFVEKLVKYSFNNLERMPKLTMPLLVCHGAMDTIIPLHHAEQLHTAAASKHKKLWIAPKGNHTNLEQSGMLPVIQQFIERH